MTGMSLRVSDVVAGYGALTVLWGVSFEVPSNHVLVILGPNGAGKSTLMSVIAGVLPTSAGSIWKDGQDITSMGYARRAKLGIGWVPEGRNVFEHLSIKDNLDLSEPRGKRADAARERREDVLGLFPVLRVKMNHRAGTLSGGEQQILAIARTLLRNPSIILLDEPSAGLAPIVVDRLAQSLEFMKKSGAAVIVTEQSPAWLGGLVDSIQLMQGGRMTNIDGTDLITSRESLRKAYLGGSL